jgi:chromosomal replication initiation ATPase DnaA
MRMSINDDNGLEKRNYEATVRLLELLQEHHDYSVPKGIVQRIEIKTAPTIEFSVDVCVLPIPAPKLTIDAIKRVVCLHYGVSHSDMISPRREQKIAYPRMIAIYLARVLTSRSFPEIGRHFGGRDHSTIIHAIRKVKNFIDQGHPLASHVVTLQEMLAP